MLMELRTSNKLNKYEIQLNQIREGIFFTNNALPENLPPSPANRQKILPKPQFIFKHFKLMKFFFFKPVDNKSLL